MPTAPSKATKMAKHYGVVMRILITNDDGINAPGLEVMHDIAVALAGDADDVWTVAPALEQSGVGHSISFTRPMMVVKQSPRSFAVEGTPADCVLAGLYEVLKDNPPDLVLSGVNRGNNSAENTVYSGTIGAAMEAALQGIPAIALSQYYGPGNRNLDDTFDAARQHGLDTVRKILDHSPVSDNPYELFYNVNFPPLKGSEVKGIRVCTQGRRPEGRFTAAPQTSPNGRRYLWITSGAQAQPSEGISDAAANLDGYISVTPMRADLTAHEMLAPLKGIE